MDFKKGVTFEIFTWTIGIILVLFGFLFTEIKSATDQAQASTQSSGDVASDVKVIKNNICWLMQAYPNHPPCN